MTSLDKKKLITCHDCDLLMEVLPVTHGQKGRCPRCRAVVVTHVPDSLNKTLAVSIAGLLSFYPALTQPLIGLQAAGLKNEASLISCIQTLFASELYLVTSLVVLFCILFPLARLTIAFTVVLIIKTKGHSIFGLRLFRFFRHWNEWAMLDVFLLGMIVSLYKIIGLADPIFGAGLVAFSMLLLSATLLNTYIDEELVWERLYGG